MKVSRVVAQLRTTDLETSIRFYTNRLGFDLAFRYQDFYAGIRAGDDLFHLKQVDAKDPSIAYVRDGEHVHLYLETDDVDGLAASLTERGVTPVKAVHDTHWGTREFVIEDDQGHTLHFGLARQAGAG